MNGQTYEYRLKFTTDMSGAKNEINKLANELNGLSTLKGVDLSKGITPGLKDAQKAAAELEVILKRAYDPKTNTMDFSQLKRDLKESGKSIEDFTNEFAKAGSQGRQLTQSLASGLSSVEPKMYRITDLAGKLWTSLKQTARYQLSNKILMGFTSALRDSFQYAKDLNKNLNDIRIVTGYNTDAMAKFAIEANKAAKALSTSTNEYAKASLIYYQQGLADDAVLQRTDATVKLANVTGESAQKVSDQMTAIWNNFDDGSKSLEYYADVITALGAATASSTDEISEGLEKFAGTAQTIGLSYEYATSALATVTAQTRQSADVVGTAFKTMFARMQGLKLGETLDDGTTLNQYSQAMEKIGVSIKDSNGNLKDMDTILNEMGQTWDTLTKAEQVATAQQVAGLRQYNQLVALMDNWDFFKENLSTAKAATGELEKQHQIYEESWAAAEKRVQASLESIYQNLIDDDFFIKLTDGLAGFLDLFGNLVEGMGGMAGVLPTIISLFTRLFTTQISGGLSKGMGVMDNLLHGAKDASQVKRDAGKAARGQIDFEDATAADKTRLEIDKEILKVENEVQNLRDKGETKQAELLERKVTAMKEQREEAARLAQEGEGVKSDDSLKKNIVNQLKKEGISKKDAQQLAQQGIDDQHKRELYKERVLKSKGDLDWKALEKETGIKANKSTQEKIRQELSNDNGVSATLEAKLTRVQKEQTQALTNNIEALKKKKGALKEAKQAVQEESSAIDQNTQDVKENTTAKENNNQPKKSGNIVSNMVVENAKKADSVERANDIILGVRKEANGIAKDKNTPPTEEKNNERIAVSYDKLGQSITNCAMYMSSAMGVVNSFNGAIKAIGDDSLTFKDRMTQLSGSALGLLMNLGPLVPLLGKLKNTTWGAAIAGLFAKKSTDEQSKANLKQVITEKLKEKGIKSSTAAMWGSLLPVLAVVAGIAVLITTISLLVKWKNKEQEAAEKATKAAENARKEYDRAKQSHDALIAGFSAYDEAAEKLDKLTKGTQEYNEALIESNNQLLDLMEKYPELAQYISDDGTGRLVISEEGRALATQKSFENQQNAAMARYNAQIRANEAKKIADERKMSEDTLKTFAQYGAEGLGGTVGGLASGAAAGALIGSVIPVIGTAAGAIIGGLIGGVTGAVMGGSRDTTDREVEALREIEAAYKVKGNAVLAPNEIRELLKSKGYDKAFIDEMAKNSDAIRDLITSNTALEAQNKIMTQQIGASVTEGDRTVEKSGMEQGINRLVGNSVQKVAEELLKDTYANMSKSEIQRQYAMAKGYDTSRISKGENGNTKFYANGDSENPIEVDIDTMKDFLAFEEAKETSEYDDIVDTVTDIAEAIKIDEGSKEALGNALADMKEAQVASDVNFENLSVNEADALEKNAKLLNELGIKTEVQTGLVDAIKAQLSLMLEDNSKAAKGIVESDAYKDVSIGVRNEIADFLDRTTDKNAMNDVDALFKEILKDDDGERVIKDIVQLDWSNPENATSKVKELLHKAGIEIGNIEDQWGNFVTIADRFQMTNFNTSLEETNKLLELATKHASNLKFITEGIDETDYQELASSMGEDWAKENFIYDDKNKKYYARAGAEDIAGDIQKKAKDTQESYQTSQEDIDKAWEVLNKYGFKEDTTSGEEILNSEAYKNYEEVVGALSVITGKKATELDKLKGKQIEIQPTGVLSNGKYSIGQKEDGTWGWDWSAQEGQSADYQNTSSLDEETAYSKLYDTMQDLGDNTYEKGYDRRTATYYIKNKMTGEIVEEGLNSQQANIRAVERQREDEQKEAAKLQQENSVDIKHMSSDTVLSGNLESISNLDASQGINNLQSYLDSLQTNDAKLQAKQGIELKTAQSLGVSLSEFSAAVERAGGNTPEKVGEAINKVAEIYRKRTSLQNVVEFLDKASKTTTDTEWESLEKDLETLGFKLSGAEAIKNFFANGGYLSLSKDAIEEKILDEKATSGLEKDIESVLGINTTTSGTKKTQKYYTELNKNENKITELDNQLKQIELDVSTGAKTRAETTAEVSKILDEQSQLVAQDLETAQKRKDEAAKILGNMTTWSDSQWSKYLNNLDDETKTYWQYWRDEYKNASEEILSEQERLIQIQVNKFKNTYKNILEYEKYENLASPFTDLENSIKDCNRELKILQDNYKKLYTLSDKQKNLEEQLALYDRLEREQKYYLKNAELEYEDFTRSNTTKKQIANINQLLSDSGSSIQLVLGENGFENTIAVREELSNLLKNEPSEALQNEIKKFITNLNDLINTEAGFQDKVDEARDDLTETQNNQAGTKQTSILEFATTREVELQRELEDIEHRRALINEENIFNNSELMKLQMEQYKWTRTEYAAAMTEMAALEANKEAWAGDEAGYEAKREEITKRINNALVEQKNSLKEIEELYRSTYQSAWEMYDRESEKFDQLNSELDHYSNLLGALNRDNEYETYDKIYTAQLQNINTSLGYEKQQAAKILRDIRNTEAQLAEVEVGSDEYNRLQTRLKEYEDLYQTTQNNIISLTEQTAELATQIFENALKQNLDTFQKAISGDTSLDDLIDKLEDIERAQEKWYDSVNQIYETTSLIRKINTEITKSDSKTGQQKLIQFRKEIQEMQKQEKLSKFELENAQKKYEILLAEIALQEAQNAKNTVRLTRNAAGGWTYLYGADEEATAEAQQNYDDKVNEHYNYLLEQETEQRKELYNLSKQAGDDINALYDDYMAGKYTEEQFEAEKQRRLKYWTDLMEDETKIFKLNLTEQGKDVSEADKIWEDFSTNINVLLENNEKALTSWKNNVKTAFDSVGEDADETAKKINKVEIAHDEMAEHMDEVVIPAVNRLIAKMKELNEQYELAAGYANNNSSPENEEEDDYGDFESSNPNFRPQPHNQVPGGIAGIAVEGYSDLELSNALAAKYGPVTPVYAKTGTKGLIYWVDEGGNVVHHPYDADTDDLINEYRNNKKSKKSSSKPNTSIYSTDGVIGTSGEAGGLVYKVKTDAGVTYVDEGGNFLGTKPPDDLIKLATGGYTGEFGPEGRLAILHEKELVLNQTDTKNLLDMVAVARDLIKNSRWSMFNSFESIGSIASRLHSEALQQSVSIEASFPNVTDRNEIQEAFNNLINTAAQYANRGD